MEQRVRLLLYILDEHGTPVPLSNGNCHEVLRWAKFMEGDNNRVVKRSLLFHSSCLIGTTCSSK